MEDRVMIEVWLSKELVQKDAKAYRDAAKPDTMEAAFRSIHSDEELARATCEALFKLHCEGKLMLPNTQFTNEAWRKAK